MSEIDFLLRITNNLRANYSRRFARLNPEPNAQGTNPGKTARPVGPVLFWFFVRLVVAAAVLYVSLRSLDGKVSALLIGLSLALVALFIEAIRLFHAWSV